MPENKELREKLKMFQDASLYVRGAEEYDKLINQYEKEILALIKPNEAAQAIREFMLKKEKILNSICSTCRDNDICKGVGIRKECGAYKPICECGK